MAPQLLVQTVYLSEDHLVYRSRDEFLTGTTLTENQTELSVTATLVTSFRTLQSRLSSMSLDKAWLFIAQFLV